MEEFWYFTYTWKIFYFLGNGSRDIQVESTRYCAAPANNNYHNTPQTRHPRPSSVGSRYTPTRDYSSSRQRNSPKFRNRSPSLNPNLSLPTRHNHNSRPNFAEPLKANKAIVRSSEASTSVKNNSLIEEKVARLKAKEASRYFSLLPSLIPKTEEAKPDSNKDIYNVQEENKNDELKIDSTVNDDARINKAAQDLRDMNFDDITKSTSPLEMNITRNENSGKLYLLE